MSRVAIIESGLKTWLQPIEEYRLYQLWDRFGHDAISKPGEPLFSETGEQIATTVHIRKSTLKWIQSGVPIDWFTP